MGSFTVHRMVGASARRTWDVVVDWPRHSGTVPLTTVRAVAGPGGGTEGEGSGLVARTGIGALAYDDLMLVTHWQPPDETGSGRCRLEKQGRAVTGRVCLTVVPVAPRRCRLTWQERVDVVGVHRLPFGDIVESAVGHVVFSRVLRRLARQAEAA
jgi:hypothetical protein